MADLHLYELGKMNNYIVNLYRHFLRPGLKNDVFNSFSVRTYTTILGITITQ